MYIIFIKCKIAAILTSFQVQLAGVYYIIMQVLHSIPAMYFQITYHCMELFHHQDFSDSELSDSSSSLLTD